MTIPKAGEVVQDKIGKYFVKKIVTNDGEDLPTAFIYELSKYSLLRRIELLILRLWYK